MPEDAAAQVPYGANHPPERDPRHLGRAPGSLTFKPGGAMLERWQEAADAPRTRRREAWDGHGDHAKQMVSAHAVDYRIERLPIKEHPEAHLAEILDRLNELGKQGWRVVSIDLTHHPSYSVAAQPSVPLPVLLEKPAGATRPVEYRIERMPFQEHPETAPLRAARPAHRAREAGLVRGERRPDPPPVVLGGGAAQHAAARAAGTGDLTGVVQREAQPGARPPVGPLRGMPRDQRRGEVEALAACRRARRRAGAPRRGCGRPA